MLLLMSNVSICVVAYQLKIDVKLLVDILDGTSLTF